MFRNLRKRASSIVCGVKPKVKKLLKAMAPYTDDLLIAAGLVVAVVTTYQWSPIAGGYVLAASLIAAGVVIARQPPTRR
jgi:hypothetical protein